MQWLRTDVVCSNLDDLNNLPKRIAGIYRIYDKNGGLLYIGRSVNLRTRVKQHFQGSTHTSRYHHLFFSSLMTFAETVGRNEHYINGVPLHLVERKMIETLRPRFNMEFVYPMSELILMSTNRMALPEHLRVV